MPRPNCCGVREKSCIVLGSSGDGGDAGCVAGDESVEVVAVAVVVGMMRMTPSSCHC